MSEEKLTFKSLKVKIATALITACFLGLGGIVWAKVRTVPGHAAIKSGIVKTLQQYENDINHKTFDAHRYFASDVVRFFDAEKKTPAWINTFWANHFNRLFPEMSIRLDFSSLKLSYTDDGITKASIIMYSTFYNADEKKQHVNERSRYDLKFDEDYRMVYMVQEIY